MRIYRDQILRERQYKKSNNFRIRIKKPEIMIEKNKDEEILIGEYKERKYKIRIQRWKY